MHTRAARFVVLCSLLGLAGAAMAQPARRLPIYVGTLAVDAGKTGKTPAASKANPRALRTCAPDWEMPAAIKKTLAQMGEEVADWPAAVAPELCVGVDCAKRLRSAVREGYLLGGQIATSGLGPAHLDLWLIDLAARRIMVAQHDCLGCEKPEVVARHAAAVVQRRTELQAPWFPLELTPCSPSAEKLAGTPTPDSAEAPQVLEHARQPILLAVYGTRVPEKLRKSVTQGAMQYLEMMGHPAQEFRSAIQPEAPRSSLRPQQQASRLLDIEIQGTGHKMTDVLLRLSDAQDTRQTTFQCANLKDCTASSLVQQVQLHVGTLIDRLDAPPQVEAAEGGAEVCMPAPVCVAELTKQVVDALPPPAPPPPAVATQPSEERAVAPAGEKAGDPQPQPNLAPSRMLGLCPPPGRARKLKIGGWSLIGLGGALVAAAIVPSVLSTVSGVCRHSDDLSVAQLCNTPPQAPNYWPLAAAGYSLGALSIGGGIGLLVWSHKESKIEATQGGSVCPH